MKATHVLWATVAATLASLSLALPSVARPATLIAQDAGSRINIRSSPSTRANAPHYGIVGDRIEVMSSVLGADEYNWNYVKFRSGAKGWVRGDFVNYTEGLAEYGLLLGQDGRLPYESSRQRINVRSAPSTTAASLHYGLTGDVVQILSQKTGSDGFVWRYVKFPSGAAGWVRGDLLQAMAEGGC